jgi:hypothetical protein
MRGQYIAYHGWPRTFTQSLVWPLISLVKAVRSFRCYPLPAGSGLGARLITIARRWWLQLAHNLMIADQAYLLLHLPAYQGRPTAFISNRENLSLLALANLRSQGFPNIHRKNPFARFCAEHRLPTARAFMTGQGSTVLSAQPLPSADLFLKLANSGEGEGAEILPRASGANAWLGADGSLLAETDLAAYVGQQLGDQPWIIQERLQNAPSWRGFTAGALSTVRIVTARRHPSGSPECLIALLRLPRKNSAVDNLSAGGLGTHIDLATGRLNEARDWVDVHTHHDRHPDTGGQITGTLLPGWEDIKTLALHAHTAAGDWFSLGWDISLTERGLILIETNLNWAITPFAPIQDTRYIEVMESLFFPTTNVHSSIASSS